MISIISTCMKFEISSSFGLHTCVGTHYSPSKKSFSITCYISLVIAARLDSHLVIITPFFLMGRWIQQQMSNQKMWKTFGTWGASSTLHGIGSKFELATQACRSNFEHKRKINTLVISETLKSDHLLFLWIELSPRFQYVEIVLTAVEAFHYSLSFVWHLAVWPGVSLWVGWLHQSRIWTVFPYLDE